MKKKTADPDRPRKKLALQRQTLRKLTLNAEQLRHVAGGMYVVTETYSLHCYGHDYCCY
ncbi:MAG TPA: hypothetical protein VKB80_24325 [Kofleriaceae bacterium]|nr:hypothetical protein [Kofleriaceae bacterium]